MKNWIQKGNVVEVKLLADAVSGDIVVIGGIIGVAVTSGVTGDIINIERKGVYLMPVASALVIAVGEPAYVVDATGVLTNVATAATEVGTFLSASADGELSVELLMAG